jgi:hypothetical protein
MPVDSIRRSRAHSLSTPTDAPSARGPDAARRQHASGTQLSAGTRHILSHHMARTSRVAPAAPSPAQIAQRLDEFMRAMQGPYTVGGKQVQVAADFRMNDKHSINQLPQKTDKKRIKEALGPKEYAKLAYDAAMATEGKGSPEEIRRVTQALIDSPAFAKYAALPPERAVRHLMWDYGIGTDCSGYTHRAFLYSRGTEPGKSAPAARYALGPVGKSNVHHPPPGVFRRIQPENARPGDLIRLIHAADDNTGHSLIVYARRSIAPGNAEYTACAQALGSPAGAHIDVLEVDSSWGAGGNPDNGGVARRSWAYDESTHRWATLYKGAQGEPHAVRSSQDGPYDHDLQGIYRPRSEK